MTTEIIEVGTRVRINDQFGLSKSDDDQTVSELVYSFIGKKRTEEARQSIIGRIGTVVEVAQGVPWPYVVKYDKDGYEAVHAAFELDVMADGEPSTAVEVEVVDA